MFNTEFIKKLGSDVLEEIAYAQKADLIERRNIKDPQLFKECFENATPVDTEIWEDVINFSEIAGKAFIEYHAKRAEQKAAVEATADNVSNSKYAIYLVSCGTRQLYATYDTEEEANEAAENMGWSYLDENEFEWGLEVDEANG